MISFRLVIFLHTNLAFRYTLIRKNSDNPSPLQSICYTETQATPKLVLQLMDENGLTFHMLKAISQLVYLFSLVLSFIYLKI